MINKGKILVVAPHPDDETLGVGGTLLRRRREGATISWLIMTGISVQSGWSSEKVAQRTKELKQISSFYGFHSVFELGFPAAQLDLVPRKKLIDAVSGVLNTFKPNEVFIPHSSDIHSDHRITFETLASCAKWFRNSSLSRLMAYETLSETDFSVSPSRSFQPNVFINIDGYLEEKLRAMSLYASELGEFPFPRSYEAVTALAILRGANSGFKSAEAFELLKEVF